MHSSPLPHLLALIIGIELLTLSPAVLAQSSTVPSREVERLKVAMDRVQSLHHPMGEVQPGDWLSTYKESGQTFANYIAGRPTLPTSSRRILAIQPLGEFTASQRKIVSLTASYMEHFFGMPAKLLPEKELPVIPEDGQRIHPRWGVKQIRSTYLLSNVLKPALPPDAHALIAFTSSDLYPGAEMNFVFGQASLSDRVGVWSLHRLGKPDQDEDEFRRCLLRTMKIATHETGHMFGIMHCTQYECNMNGSNSISETDRHPADACPECMAKICWATHYDPLERYQRLATFAKDQGLTIEASFFQKVSEALDANSPK